MYIGRINFVMLSDAYLGSVRVETRQTITFFSSGGPREHNVILKFYDKGVCCRYQGHVGTSTSS